MGSKTEGWAGTKMQRVILLKRPTFLLYDGVESLLCAILLKLYKLQFPVSIKSSFQDKKNKTVAVLIFIMNKSYHDAPTILVLYRKGHSPPVLRVPGWGKSHPSLLQDPRAAEQSGVHWQDVSQTQCLSNEAITQLGSLMRQCPKAASDSPSRHRRALHSVP